jgi:YVTN family beta-propeller protein
MLYVCCENNHSVVVIDPRERRVVDAIDTGSTNTHRLTVLPKHRTLWTENEEDSSLTIIDLDERKAISKITLPHAIAGIAVDPSETFVVAVDAEVPQLLVIDVATQKLTRTIHLQGHSKGSQVARFSADGQHLLVIGDHEPLVTLFSARSDGRSVCLFDHDTYEQLPVKVGNKPMDAAFSLDGKTVVVANEDDGTLSVIDLRSRRVTKTVSAGKGCETLAYF